MFDSVTASNIPADARMVGGYSDGRYAWSEADFQRFPTAQRVRVTVFAHDVFGDVLDVENGDATPQQAPGWVQKRRDQGAWPSVYMNSSTWPSVRDAMRAAKIEEPPYWVAQYDGNPELMPGAVAKQYQSTNAYDLSSVANFWPGIDGPQEEEAVFDYIPAGPDAGWYVWRTDGHVETFSVPYFGGGNTVPGGMVGTILHSIPWTDEHGALGFEIRTNAQDGIHGYRFSENHVNGV